VSCFPLVEAFYFSGIVLIEADREGGCLLENLPAILNNRVCGFLVLHKLVESTLLRCKSGFHLELFSSQFTVQSGLVLSLSFQDEFLTSGQASSRVLVVVTVSDFSISNHPFFSSFTGSCISR